MKTVTNEQLRKYMDDESYSIVYNEGELEAVVWYGDEIVFYLVKMRQYGQWHWFVSELLTPADALALNVLSGLLEFLDYGDEPW